MENKERKLIMNEVYMYVCVCGIRKSPVRVEVEKK